MKIPVIFLLHPGGDFSIGMHSEWDLFGRLKLPRIDLTRPPMPALLTAETFSEEMRTSSFRQTVIKEFQTVLVRAAA